MKYYPVCIDVKNRNCLVVGGGSVGTRKIKTLVECGALITLISLDISEFLVELAGKSEIIIKKRSYVSGDLEGMFLVIGATNNEKLNMQIHADADRLNILCNIADYPSGCSFILPSVVERGDLLIAISTSGKSPALAKKIRKELENCFGTEYADFLILMGAIRKKLLRYKKGNEYYKPMFEKLVNSDLIGMIKNKKKDEADLFLEKNFGKGFDLDSLLKDRD